MLEEVNKLKTIGQKFEYMKTHLSRKYMKDIRFLLDTPEIKRYVQFMVNRGRSNMKDFTEEEYIPLSDLVFILQSLYNYSTEESPISDEDYDVLYEILENKDINIITTPVLRKDVVHHKYTHLRGTLEKIYALDDEENISNETRRRLSDWIKTSEKSIKDSTGEDVNLSKEEVYIFPKWDGVSIIFEIDENNKIQRALTRGNTELNEAEDVTFIFKLIESKVVCPEMKGKAYGLKTEVMMKEDDLAKYNEEHNTDYKSTRSIVSSIINSDEADGREQLLEIVKLRTSVLDEDGNESIETLVDEVFDRPFLVCSLEDVEAIRKFSFQHRYVDGLRCDGSVIYLKNKKLQKVLGRKDAKNKFEVAYKFNEEFEYTKLKDIIFQVGTFGTINPIAIIDSVVIKGNTIQRISLGSMYRFWDLKLSKGDTVKVIYEIIPYLVFDENDKKCKKSKNPLIEAPKRCPECGHDLSYKIDEETGKPVLPKCENPDCDYLKKKKIVNYIQKMNMTGISYETISTLYNYKLLKSIKDLYKIKKKDIKNIPGFAEISANHIIDEINNHRKVVDADLLGSIGIAHASKKLFQKIFKIYTIDELMDFADADEIIPLTCINGIKDAKAKIVLKGVQKNRSLILFLMDELEIISARDSRAFQCRFKACFTKIRSESIKQLIESFNGIVVDNVTKDTDFLIVPSKNTESSSVTKAKKYEIPIIPIDNVESYIKDRFNMKKKTKKPISNEDMLKKIFNNKDGIHFENGELSFD